MVLRPGAGGAVRTQPGVSTLGIVHPRRRALKGCLGRLCRLPGTGNRTQPRVFLPVLAPGFVLNRMRPEGTRAVAGSSRPGMNLRQSGILDPYVLSPFRA